MRLLRSIFVKALRAYEAIPSALYFDYFGAGASGDLTEDYRRRSVALSLFGVAQIANAALVFALLWPTLWTKIVERRSEVLLTVGLVALPLGWWLNEAIGRRVIEVKSAHTESVGTARRHYAVALCYVIGSVLALILTFLRAASMRPGR
jgi:hypothetical protein